VLLIFERGGGEVGRDTDLTGLLMKRGRDKKKRSRRERKRKFDADGGTNIGRSTVAFSCSEKRKREGEWLFRPESKICRGGGRGGEGRLVSSAKKDALAPAKEGCRGNRRIQLSVHLPIWDGRGGRRYTETS